MREVIFNQCAIYALVCSSNVELPIQVYIIPRVDYFHIYSVDHF
jgi:hypothetical protein